MSGVNVRFDVSLRDAINIIAKNGGKNTYHLRGEPGIGKTYLGKTIADIVEKPFVYIDCPGTDISEFGIPIPNHETKTVRSYPSEQWGMHLGIPQVYMLDEYAKAKMLQLILHPMLTHPRRVGATMIHPDSIVITTGNLITDGVGDMMKGHTIDRIVTLDVRKPTADEWINDFAVHNNVHPIVMAWAKREPQVMQSYRDMGNPDENPFVYNPKVHNGTGLSYVSPRSLEMASHSVWNYTEHLITESQMMASLEGAIGAAGARELSAFIDLADQIPSNDEIRDEPETATLPESPAAMCIVTLAALQWVKDRRDVTAWFKYMQRLPTENQALFVLTANDREHLKELLGGHKPYAEWAVANKHLFGM